MSLGRATSSSSGGYPRSIGGFVTRDPFRVGFLRVVRATSRRDSGNDDDLEQLAIRNALAIGAGHSFIVFLRDAFPVNVLNAIEQVPEVCHIYCATANPLSVVVGETEAGRASSG